ncbi:uncharacterized protein [Diadema antillarum]|uniref:uncharacterized protein n=1 Tax=Diadema antillarum TaxID=105358 RepID=UPI003A838690
MASSAACITCLILLMFICLPGAESGWWRRRRRSPSPPPIVIEKIPPVFNVQCPVMLGSFRATSVPMRVPWNVPTATDAQSPPVTVDRYGLPPNSLFSEGDHVITYQARDTVPNYSYCEIKFSITLIKCATLSPPPNSYVSCTEGNLVGSSCTYTCFQGYTLEGGVKKRSCVERSGTAAWVGSPPRCVELTCPATVVTSPPENGQVTCTNRNVFQSVCSYTCDSGYSIPPGQTRDRVCTASGWTGSLPTCEDTSAPSFENCPPSQILYAADRQETGVASWTPPTAIDNSGSSITDVRHDGPTPGSRLPQGHYVITYTAQDENGNEGTCVFTVTIQVIHCSTIPISPGLLASCPHGNLRGSTCTFSCSLGYRLQGPDTTTCQRDGLSGRWTNQPPVCEELQCPTINPPENGAFLNGRACQRSYGTSCYFECLLGFRINNNVLRCVVQPGSEEAFWEGTVPECEVETCDRPSLTGPLDLHDNSSTCATSVQVPAGNDCEFECSRGYVIQGSATTTCGLSGTWEQPLPTCEAVTCLGSNLPPPLHGGKSGCPHEREQYGTVCTLYCDLGYQPSETAPVIRECLDDGEGGGLWSGGPISCSVVQCLPLDAPVNGHLEDCTLDSEASDPTLRQDYRTICTVFCDEGYTPMGTSSRRCLADGRWDGVPQTCEDHTAPAIDCPHDRVIFAESGQSVGTIHWDQLEPVQATDANTVITAQLESIDSVPITGSRPTTLVEGDHSLVYRATDAAGNSDTCSFDVQVKVVRCPPLFAPGNGAVTLSSGQGSCEGGAVLGSTCQVTCNTGFDLSSNETIANLRCVQQEEGTTVGAWDTPLPLCEIATCEVNPHVNSSVQGCPFASVNYGEQCQFVCNDGFLSSSGIKSVTRACQEDGSLSGEELICDRPVTCPSGFSLEHGTITPEICTASDARVPYDTPCNFHCHNGFLQYGPYVKTCTAEGSWSDSRPVVCEDRQEPSFDEACPRYINVNAARGTLSTVVDFDIPTATDNSGNATVTRVDGFPGPNSTFTEGTTVTSYRATDPTGNSARCEISVRVNVYRCPRLQAPARGSLVNCSDPIYGSQCSVSCNEGYELVGPQTRTCELDNGQAPAFWDGEDATCQPRTCPALPTPPQAVKSGCSQDSPGVEIFGTLCSFYCPHGFYGEGDSHRRCQADGTWSGTDFTCRATACEPLKAPQGVLISPPNCMEDPRFGETCLLRCETPGFQVRPQTLTHTVCLGSGQWLRNASLATCVDIASPVFTACPADFSVYASRSELMGNVTWLVAAADNGPDAAIVKCDVEQGLKAEGDYDVSCVATDAAQNTQTCSFQVSVRVRRCQPLSPPVFGNLIGSCDNSWGSECEVGCSVGYTLVGPSHTSCEFTGQSMHWERDDIPFCDIVGCDPLNLPMGIGVYPSSCANQEKLYHGTECTFFCRDGLTIEGAVTVVRCGTDGEWDASIDSLGITCIDEVAPTLTSCPGPKSVTQREGWGVEVTFDLPTAEDNLDDELTVVTGPAYLTSPYNFTQETTASFTFSDSAGNNVTCSFPIYIRDEIPPVVEFCPPDISLNTSETLTEVSWDPPIFIEVTGDDLLITSNYDNDMALLPWGRHVVNYQATNTDNGETVGCEFSVEIMPVTCKELDVPSNGALTCDQWAYGRFCSIHCNVRFDIPRLPPSRRPPEHYVCGSSGLWSPHAYVPDCSRVRRPGRSNLPSELLYFTGSCGTQETQDEIAAAFLQILINTDFSDICTQTNQCTVANVRVTCGDISSVSGRRRRRRRRDDSSRVPGSRVEAMSARSDDVNRARRDVGSQQVVSVEWDFVTNVNQDPSLSNFDAAIEAEDLMMAMSDVIQDEIDAGTFPTLNVPGSNLTLDDTSLTFGYSEVLCNHGFTADNEDLQCVPCVAGTFYDEVTKVCQLCPRGSYQELAGQSHCVPCEEGQSTEGEGSINATQCKDICEAGHFSTSGLVPCRACEMGTYQPTPMSASCLPCPNGTSTMDTAASSQDQCLEWCQPGSFSITGFVPCETCPIGSFQSRHQQRSCDPCPDHLSTPNRGAQDIQECTDANECVSEPCQNGATCVDLVDSFRCNCAPGFEGVTCEVDIDECALLQPCQRGGTCIDQINGYSCSCPIGLSGDNCETVTILCDNYCLNNGSCIPSTTDMECQCVDGYHGPRCEFATRPCFPSPCLNDGDCREMPGEVPDFRCDCAPGFSGVDCSRNINECNSQPCRNGGMCVDEVNDFSCICTPGYTGPECGVDVDLCIDHSCENSGTCFDLGDAYECLCPPGYAGELCEREKNACDDEPCQNGGVCSLGEDPGQDYSCECQFGFIGRNCEVNRDDCASGPCSNGATCADGIDSYNCTCADGFTGPTCEENVDLCATQPCSANATCLSVIGGFQCVCPPGYQGVDCSEVFDFCEGEERCLNGGTCINEVDWYSCHCRDGFQGPRCEVDINECASEPCFHGSTCLDMVGNFSCECAPGFAGILCDENINECLSSPCVNGTCVDGVDAFVCDCHQGYSGTFCEAAIDFCADAPCSNSGVCTNTGTGFSCTCLSGYTGNRCEIDVDECSSFPCYQGNCEDMVDGYLCRCSEGFSGVHCEVDVNECRSGPCRNNGTCVDRPGSYLCQCVPGFEGVNCEINTDDCTADSCYNNGTCHDDVGGFHCTCQPGFSGPFCQLVDTPACSSHPCLNGGRCRETPEGGSYACTCLDGFQGDVCEEDVDECADSQCQNGATCVDQVNGYTCQCPPGFNGSFCKENVNECISQPCLHDSTCLDGVASFSCQCSQGYTGERCETDIDECASSPCENLGICEDMVAGFLCQCADGFRWITCAEESMECESDPCLNGGTCVEGFLQFVCQCAPGYTGRQCETALPTDFDLVFIGQSKIVNLTINEPDGLSRLTLSTWLRGLRATPDFRLFSYNFQDEEYSLYNLCNLKITSGSVTYNVGTSLCDNRWHHIHVMWTFTPTSSWTLSVDREEPLSGNVTMAAGHAPSGGRIWFGADMMGNTDYVAISAYNVWSSELSDAVQQSLASSCQPALFGDIVSWTDMPSHVNVSSNQLESPSQCDDVNECLSDPCQRGSCQDKLGSYHCECEEGYTGTQCEQAQDLCSPEFCRNGGTCETKEATALCHCPNGFSGDFCEVEKVDGGWSNWSLWSECSLTCAGGVQSRTRTCTDPVPQGGGLNCTGKEQQERTCNDVPCPGCLRLRRPLRGYLRCRDVEDTKTCSISCRRGYGFAERIQESYTCGKDSNYRWSHQTKDNPFARLPSCTELMHNQGATGIVSVAYPGAICQSRADRDYLRNAANNLLTETSDEIECIADRTCRILAVQVKNCELQINRRRSVRATAPVTISITVQQNASSQVPLPESDNSSSATLEPPDSAEPLDIFYFNLTSLINNGSFTLEVNDQHLASDPTSFTGDAWENCPPGYLESASQGYCVPCGAGTYFGMRDNGTEYECVSCPEDTYQDEEAQEECIPCPEDHHTLGMHSTNETDCRAPIYTTVAPHVPVTEHPTTWLLPLGAIIGIAVTGFCVLLIVVVGIICWRCRKREKTGSETANDIQLLNATAVGNETNPYSYVYNGDHGTVNPGFVYGAEGVSTNEELQSDSTALKEQDLPPPYTPFPSAEEETDFTSEFPVKIPPSNASKELGKI